MIKRNETKDTTTYYSNSFYSILFMAKKYWFYPEFNGMTILKQKDVYGESFHKTTPIGGWLDSRIS